MRTIRLYDTESILPQTLSITCRSNEQEWDIAEIQIYADPECKTLIADDIQIGQLSPSSQLSIYAALNAHQHEQEQRRFAADVRLQAEANRDMANALRLAPVFDSIFSSFKR